MSLFIVATPIGHPDDITLRALDILKSADVIIGEERKEVHRLLRHHKIEGKRLELLNEHTRETELHEMIALCRAHPVALVSDCGTPGFCDPGANLVKQCRSLGVHVSPIPGASSLMTLLSVAGTRLDQFVFEGFLPANKESRLGALKKLKKEKRPIVLMDTPYRLTRLLNDLCHDFSACEALLGVNLTSETEIITQDTVKGLLKTFNGQKAEFILILYPQ